MTPESIPPSVSGGNDDPPPDLPRRVLRLYSADDIRRDVLGEESEPPPGLVTLKPPVGAVPSLPNLTPAISGTISVLRLPEVQAGIDLVRIAAPRMEQYSARMQQALAPQIERMNAQIRQALAPMVAQANANFAESVSHIGASLESLGRVALQDLLSDQMLRLRYVGASLESIAQVEPDISHRAPDRTYEKWAAANPCWPLVFDVGMEREGWETSLAILTGQLDFAPTVEVLERRGLDAYAATLAIRWVLKQAIDGLRDRRTPDMPPALLPYLQGTVQGALSGQRPLLMPGLLGAGKTHGGGPIPRWLTEDECRAAVVPAIRYQLGQYSANLQESVAAQLGFAGSGLRDNLRRFNLDWRELVAEAKARR